MHHQGCAEVLLTQHSKLAEPPGMLTSPKELWDQITLRLDQAACGNGCGSDSGHPGCWKLKAEMQNVPAELAGHSLCLAGAGPWLSQLLVPWP